jgi:hypothetical protein
MAASRPLVAVAVFRPDEAFYFLACVSGLLATLRTKSARLQHRVVEGAEIEWVGFGAKCEK